MSTSQFPLGASVGKIKKGNGVEYLMHQEKVAQKQNLKEMKPMMYTRDNVYYTKMRNDIEAKYKRLQTVKTKEVEAQNEKMYGKLLSILDNEHRSISKHRASAGPISLNVAVRRKQINTINNENEVISKKLNETKCTVPTKEKLDAHSIRIAGFKRAVSTRRAGGELKPDPLTQKRMQFQMATQLSSPRQNLKDIDMFMSASAREAKHTTNVTQDSNFQMDELMINPMYQPAKTQKSMKQESAKRQLPFNVGNIKKHQFKNKYPTSTSPLTTSIQNLDKNLDVTNDEFKKQLDASVTSPLADTITKLMQKQSDAELDKVKKGLFQSSSISMASNMLNSGPVSTIGRKVILDPFDTISFMNTLVIDDNNKIEDQQREKLRQENIKLDPFLKAFLSKKSMTDATNTASNQSTKLSRNHFSQRNSSQQIGPSGLTGKISESLVNQLQGQTAKSKMQDGTGAYDAFVGHQAISNAKLMLNNQSPDSSALQVGLKFQIGTKTKREKKFSAIPVKKKTIYSARKSNKSPLDMHDFTNMTKPDEEPNFKKFMNQSSSQKLEFADQEPQQPSRSPKSKDAAAQEAQQMLKDMPEDIILNERVKDMTSARKVKHGKLNQRTKTKSQILK